MRFRPLFVLAGLIAALALAAPIGAAVRQVHPGHSIQAAVDAAHPGDIIIVHPGIYHENLTITTSHLTLRGTPGKRGTRLRPAATPLDSPCTQGGAVNGICVAGPSEPVWGTTVSGFNVVGYSGFGVVLFNANNSTVRHVMAARNAGYGISGFGLSGVRFIDNLAHHNGEPGFYIGDSPDADALVKDNTSFKNGLGGPEGLGFLFRDSSEGVVVNNRAWGNCVGIVFVDSGENPDPLNNWVARGNRASENNGACIGDPTGPPPLSGIGILGLGAHKLTLVHNRVFGNAPSGPSAFSGGISVDSSAGVGGADPTNNRIVENWAFRNSPVDVFWDGSGSGNRFARNHCSSSTPTSICH